MDTLAMFPRISLVYRIQLVDSPGNAPGPPPCHSGVRSSTLRIDEMVLQRRIGLRFQSYQDRVLAIVLQERNNQKCNP